MLEAGEEGLRERQSRDAETRLAVLARATRAFAEASRSPPHLFDAVVREIAAALNCACSLSLVSDDGAHFTTPYVHATDPEFLAALLAHFAAGDARPLAGHPGLCHVFGNGTPFLLADVAGSLEALGAGASPEVLRFAHGKHVKSSLVVPLNVSGRLIGALALTRHGEHAALLDQHDLAFAQTLAEHAALALVAARLLEASERELVERGRMAARLRLLTEASREFSDKTNDFDQLLATIARRLAETIGDLCAIRAISEDGALLEAGAVYHRDPEILAWARELLHTRVQAVGEGASGRVAATGQSLFIPRTSAAEYAASTLPEYREILERLRVGSVIIVPLVCRGEVIGVATLLRSSAENPYVEDDLHLVRSLADHAALAIANARSYAAERAARAAAVQAREALLTSEVAHRLLFDANPIALLVFDLETYAFLAVNDAAVKLYGYPRDVFLRMKLKELRPEVDRPAPGSIRHSPDAEAVGTVRHLRSDGSLFFAEYVSRPLNFAGRRARITSVTDVTARHEAEEMRALLAAIVESSNDAIVSKRLDGTITSWNAAAQRLFGYPAAQVVGRSIAVVVPPDLLTEEGDLLRRVAGGESVEHYETRRVRKDGSEVVVSISLAPILDAARQVVGISKTARDLTAQRAAAAALSRTEEQLRQAQKMEAVGRLAGGIAHDFNNVLSVILTYAEMLQADFASSESARADIDEIHAAAVRAAELTRQLLLFSRRQVVEAKLIDLNDVLTGLDKMLRRIVGEDVELTTLPAENLAEVFADPSNVAQVVMNLVVNAREAMPRGGKITIETSNVELGSDYVREHVGAKAGPHVMLAVSDTGIGMDGATQAHIFEPFFTTKGTGTGLGLSTVFGIAQQAGGSVWVYSELGEGTTFKVYFPVAESKREATRQRANRVARRGCETVLLVEDQAQVRAVAHRALTRNGYQVIVAETPGEALSLCEQHSAPIHILLTDVVMPQMSGAELAKRLAPLRPEMKVLFMSGYTDDSVVRHGVLEGEVAFLQKPFTPESLAHKLREVLDAGREGDGHDP